MHALPEADERRLAAGLAEGGEVLAVVCHEVVVTELVRVLEQVLGGRDHLVGRAAHLGRRVHAHEPVLARVGVLEHVDDPEQGLALQHALVRLVEVLAAEVDDAAREADEDAVVPVLLAVQVAPHRQVVARPQQSENETKAT